MIVVVMPVVIYLAIIFASVLTMIMISDRYCQITFVFFGSSTLFSGFLSRYAGMKRCSSCYSDVFGATCQECLNDIHPP